MKPLASEIKDPQSNPNFLINHPRIRVKTSRKTPKSSRLPGSATSSPSNIILKTGKLQLSQYESLRQLLVQKQQNNSLKLSLSHRDISHIKDTHKQPRFIQTKFLPISLSHLKKYIQASEVQHPNFQLHSKIQVVNCQKQKCLDCLLRQQNPEIQYKYTSNSPNTVKLPYSKSISKTKQPKTSYQPSRRQDTINLLKWFYYMKEQYIDGNLDFEHLQSLDEKERLSKMENIHDILSVGIKELERQISVACSQRGSIFLELLNLKEEYWKIENKLKNSYLEQEIHVLQRKLENSNRERKEIFTKLQKKNEKLRVELKQLRSECIQKHKLIVELKRTVNKVKYELSAQGDSSFQHQFVKTDKKRQHANTVVGIQRVRFNAMKQFEPVNELMRQIDQAIVITRFSKNVGIQAYLPPKKQSKLTNTPYVFFTQKYCQTENKFIPFVDQSDQDDSFLQQLLEIPEKYQIELAEQYPEPLQISEMESIQKFPSIDQQDIQQSSSSQAQEVKTSLIHSPSIKFQNSIIDFPLMKRSNTKFSTKSPNRFKFQKTFKVFQQYTQTEPDMVFQTQQQQIYSALLAQKQDLLDTLSVQLTDHQIQFRRILQEIKKKKGVLKQLSYSLQHGITINSDQLIKLMKQNGCLSIQADNQTWKAGFSVGYTQAKSEKVLYQKIQEQPNQLFSVRRSKPARTFIGEVTLNNKKIRLVSTQNHPAPKFLQNFLLKHHLKSYVTLTAKMVFKMIYSIYTAASKYYLKKKNIPGLLEFSYDQLIKKFHQKNIAQKKFRQLIAKAIQMREEPRSSLYLRMLGLDKYLDLQVLGQPYSSWQLLLFLYNAFGASRTGIVVSYHDTGSAFWIPKQRAIQCVRRVLGNLAPSHVVVKIVKQIEEITKVDFLKVNSSGIVNQDLVLEIVLNEFEGFNYR